MLWRHHHSGVLRQLNNVEDLCCFQFQILAQIQRVHVSGKKRHFLHGDDAF